MHQVYPLEHAFILMNRFLQISKLQSQQETKQAPDLSIILDAVFENNFCLMWNFKRPYRRQSVLWVSKTRRSRLCKTSQTEKTQTLGILHIQQKKKKSLVRNPTSKRPLKRLSVLCHPSTCTFWPFIWEPQAAQQLHALTSTVCHNRALSQIGAPCFPLQPCDQQSPDKKHTLQLYSNTPTPPWQMPPSPEQQLSHN